MTPLLQVSLYIALIAVTLAILLAGYRILFGPTVPDRAVGTDMVATGVICMVLVVAMLENTLAFIDVAIVLAILSFLGTVALAKYIAKGVIIERDADS